MIIRNKDHNHYQCTFSCGGKIEHDLPDINIKSKLILFADETSIIVTNPNAIDFKIMFLQFLNTKVYGLNSIYYL